jgi:hypothetical protein
MATRALTSALKRSRIHFGPANLLAGPDLAAGARSATAVLVGLVRLTLMRTLRGIAPLERLAPSLGRNALAELRWGLFRVLLFREVAVRQPSSSTGGACVSPMSCPEGRLVDIVQTTACAACTQACMLIEARGWGQTLSRVPSSATTLQEDNASYCSYKRCFFATCDYQDRAAVGAILD